MHETKEGFLEICLTACMLWFIRSCNHMKEKAKTLQFHFRSKSSVSKQRRFRARFKDGTVPSRNTIIYLTVEYLMGWCVSISHMSFSGRKKHVRTAEKARLIRAFVNPRSAGGGGGKGPPLCFFANSSWSTGNFALKLAISLRPTIPHLVSKN